MKQIANALLATIQRYVHAAQDLAEAGRYFEAEAEMRRAERVGRCASKAREFLMFDGGEVNELGLGSDAFRTLELAETYQDFHVSPYLDEERDQ